MTLVLILGWTVLALFGALGTVAEFRRAHRRSARFRAARQHRTGIRW